MGHMWSRIGRMRGCDAGHGGALRGGNHHMPGGYRLLIVNATEQLVKSGVKPQNV